MGGLWLRGFIKIWPVQPFETGAVIKGYTKKIIFKFDVKKKVIRTMCCGKLMLKHYRQRLVVCLSLINTK